MVHQLEGGWWILTSIDLTQLPTSTRSQKGTEGKIEYSSREVSPTPLLTAQLAQAHAIFLLHHASGLNELHSRLGRPVFCAMLDRYWTRFARNWDVLLHGHPAVDVYSAIKLAGGGEIGIGVGEEDWGSGEREVLEDFVQRTEGLLDVVVSRFGDSPAERAAVLEPGMQAATQASTWLGAGEDPRASDGVVFSGTGALSRRSLATVSQWMEAIFTHGEGAYGIGENPSSRPRNRRRAQRPGKIDLGKASNKARPLEQEETHPKVKSPRNKAPSLRRSAIENAATPPGIPAPLVNTVERSLADATKNLQQGKTTDRPAQPSEDASSYFDTDKMVNYFKLGYGTSWTLNPKGFSAKAEEATQPEEQPPKEDPPPTPETSREPLTEVEPAPEVSDAEDTPEEPFVQKLEQSIGKFLIGLSGDLENTEFEADAMDETTGNEAASDAIRNTQRIFMRTLTVKLNKRATHRSRSRSRSSRASTIDHNDKVQVAVYIHQPFVFVFIFDLHTASLTMPSFYRSIHHQLGPMQKPLLRSTDPRRIPERMAEAIGEKADQLGAAGIYDLIYDPEKLTVRTSIPNIPLPGTPAAEGILGAPSPSHSNNNTTARTVSGAWYTLGIPIGPVSTPGLSPSPGLPSTALIRSDWTRLDALNVHLQLLNTYTATRAGSGGATDFEQTVKTARGWWIVWMRVPVSLGGGSPTPSPSPSPGPSLAGHPAESERGRRRVAGRGNENEAFLVRRAVDTSRSGNAARRDRSGGRWLIGAERTVSGGSGKETSVKGMVEGVGVDARRWVEGLVKLSSS